MTKFSKWCIQNALTINIKKSKMMIFGTMCKINKVGGINITVDDEKESL